jgi:hypothetical protein
VKSYDEALAAYTRMVQGKVTEYWNKMGFTFRPPATVEVEPGRLYDRVVLVAEQTMVHTFVRRADGAVLKAAGYRKPETKNVRSSIYDSDNGASGVTHHGAVYLR